jgi:cysteinyl-tRNA synthetase
MIWESPWGEGFPGWHVECSAMALHYLDGHVDLHIGGIDLRFPHHENERAQSNGVTTTEAVDVWLHGEHLLFEGRKMSKSAGNVVLLADLIERGFDPLALRLCFMETKYRSQMDLTWKAIEAADATIKRWRNKYQEWRQEVSHVDPETLQSLLRGIVSDLSTDLDTPKAIIKLREIERDESISRTTRANLFEIVDQFFGLGITDNRSIRVLDAEEEELLKQRELARAQRDFAKSDELREALLARKIKVIDTPTSQTWEVI